KAVPRLTRTAILRWARRHRRRTGRWPTAASGPVARAPGETWQAVDTALRAGRRGLPGGSSLVKLLPRPRLVPAAGRGRQGGRRRGGPGGGGEGGLGTPGGKKGGTPPGNVGAASGGFGRADPGAEPLPRPCATPPG